MIEAKDWVLLGVGAVVGGVIAFLTSLVFALKSSKELKREARALRKVLEVLVYGMEKQGWIEVTRDSNGETTGIVIRITPSTGQMTFTGHQPTVTVGVQGKVGVAGDIEVRTSEERKPE